jgi:ProP effector
MHEGISQLAKLYPNCFCHPRQPLKIGIREDIVARCPDIQPGLIASALKTYTRSVDYLETLKAGAARIDLDGNPAGRVTLEDEQDAHRKIAKEASRAAAKAIEYRKAANQSATKPTTGSTPAPIARPPRVGLAGLKAAALKRRQIVPAE